jgi:hypothetical protein
VDSSVHGFRSFQKQSQIVSFGEQLHRGRITLRPASGATGGDASILRRGALFAGEVAEGAAISFESVGPAGEVAASGAPAAGAASCTRGLGGTRRSERLANAAPAMRIAVVDPTMPHCRAHPSRRRRRSRRSAATARSVN